MTEFEKLFEAAENHDKKTELLDAERKKRIKTNPDGYIALPAVIPVQPKQTQSPLELVGSDVESIKRRITLKLVWMPGLPGISKDSEGHDKREALGILFPSEDTCHDMIHALELGRNSKNLCNTGEFQC